MVHINSVLVFFISQDQTSQSISYLPGHRTCLPPVPYINKKQHLETIVTYMSWFFGVFDVTCLSSTQSLFSSFFHTPARLSAAAWHLRLLEPLSRNRKNIYCQFTVQPPYSTTILQYNHRLLNHSTVILLAQIFYCHPGTYQRGRLDDLGGAEGKPSILWAPGRPQASTSLPSRYSPVLPSLQGFQLQRLREVIENLLTPAWQRASAVDLITQRALGDLFIGAKKRGV